MQSKCLGNISSGAMCIVSCDVPGLHVAMQDNIAGKIQRGKGTIY